MSDKFEFNPHGTTILAVRRDDGVAVGGDGQVTLGNTVMKGNARKVRRLFDNKVLAGFAGGTADALVAGGVGADQDARIVLIRNDLVADEGRGLGFQLLLQRRTVIVDHSFPSRLFAGRSINRSCDG